MEAKEILEALDLGEEVTTLDQLKEKHSKKFITKATAHDDEEVRGKIIGKINGSLTTKIKILHDLSPEEIKDKKIEEVLELAATKLKTKIAELESSSKKGKDEAVTELEAKLEKLKKDLLDHKGLAETASKALLEKEGAWEKEKKGWKVNSLLDTVKKDFEKELVSDIDPLKRKGFDSEIAEKYVFELDEEGKDLAVYDKDGKRIQDPKKLGAFISPKDLLISEASKHKILKLNSGSPVTKVINNNKKQEPENKNTKKSNIDPENLPPSVRARMGL
jgi:hypothetical protein